MTQNHTASVPVIRGRLFDLLSVDPNLVGLPVFYGEDSRDERGAEYLEVGHLRDDATQQAAAMGAKHREETYDVTCYVQVGGPSYTQREATERAYEVFAVVENMVRADGKLGLGAPGVYQYLNVEVTRHHFQEGPLFEGFGTLLVFTLTVTNRI